MISEKILSHPKGIKNKWFLIDLFSFSWFRNGFWVIAKVWKTNGFWIFFGNSVYQYALSVAKYLNNANEPFAMKKTLSYRISNNWFLINLCIVWLFRKTNWIHFSIWRSNMKRIYNVLSVDFPKYFNNAKEPFRFANCDFPPSRGDAVCPYCRLAFPKYIVCTFSQLIHNNT